MTRFRKAASISTKACLLAYVVAALSFSIGVGSLIVFTVFLYLGPIHVAKLDFGLTQALVFNGLLCTVFFLQHSGMIRQSTRSWMSRVISEHYFGALFSIVSGIMLLVLVLLWQETPFVLATVDGFYRWLFRAFFFLAIAGQVWSAWALKSADLFGAKKIMLHCSGATSPPAPMVVRGPYRWVRHPVYLTTMVMLWSYPDLTADRLLFNVLFTGWIIVGTLLEERDLVTNYGEDYQNYQRRVPMLFPYRKPFVKAV